MPDETRGATLKTYSKVMMSICYKGHCLGFVIVPSWKFKGRIIPNPLTGSGHDPELEWFVLSESFLENGLHALIVEELNVNGHILSHQNIENLLVGMPKRHIQRPSILHE
jgi:hypothetical protein